MILSEFDDLELVPRTLIKVVWEDITDDTVGDPDTAHLSERTTYALFWKFMEDENVGTPCVVLTYTDDPQLTAQQGWLCVPLACVTEIEVVRRPKRKRNESRQQSREQGADQAPEATGSGSGGGTASGG